MAGWNMIYGGHVLICFICLTATVVDASTSVTINSVGSLQETGHIQCGSEVTFVCLIPTYKYTMTWSIGSNIVAECTRTNCAPIPSIIIDDIKFSFDITRGIFNMTINQVTFKVDGSYIKCEDGSSAVKVVLSVKVLPKQQTVTISDSRDDSQNMINITATTGCVFPRSAVTMQWYYFETGQALKLYSMSSETEAKDLPECTSGACGGKNVVQMSSTLSIPDKQTGREYYFQIVIKHGETDDRIIINSKRPYRMELAHAAGDEEENKRNYGLIVGLSVTGVIVLAALLLVGVILYKRRNQ